MAYQRQQFPDYQFYNFLVHYCDKDETVMFEPTDMVMNRGSIRYHPDLYLPNGCKALGFKAKTLIEIKTRLVFDNIQWLRVIHDNYFQTFRNNGLTFVCVFMDEESLPQYSIEGFQGRINDTFQVITFKDLLKRVGKDYRSKKNIKEQPSDKLVSERAIAALKSEKCSFVLGAGVSVDSQLPKWDELLCNILEIAKQECHLALGKEDYDTLFKNCGSSSIILGRLASTLFNDNYKKFEKAIRRALYGDGGKIPGELATAISGLVKYKYDSGSLTSVITYNYDNLIEEGLKHEYLPAVPVYGPQQPGMYIPVYHVHGYLPQNGDDVSTIVLSEKEYHDIYKQAYLWSNVEQLHAMQRSVCFFIGFSMTDPNLRRLLDIANDGNGAEIRHFAFLRKADVAINLEGRKAEEFCGKMEEMLRGLGVAVIWYKEYKDLPAMLMNMIK